MKKIILVIVLLVIIVGVVLIVNNNDSNDSQKASIKIGVILPLTGSQAVYGEGVKDGLNLAVEDINRNYPFNLTLLYEDNASEVKNTVSSAQKLINTDNVPILITAVSQHSVAVAPIAEENEIILYTIASQASDLNDAGDWVFKNEGDYTALGKKVAELIFDHGHKKASIIYASYNGATTDATKSFSDKFVELGGEVVVSEGFTKDNQDYRTILAKIISSDATVIFVNGLTGNTGNILKQIGELGMTQQIVTNAASENIKVIEDAGPISEGVIFPTFQKILPRDFVELAENKLGHEPIRWTAEAYDGLHIIAKAISQVDGLISPSSVRDKLSNIGLYKGITGQIKFDSEGNAIRELSVRQIKDGKFIEYTN